MLKNKLSYYFWRVAIGVSIGLILMFAKSNAFALTYDLSLQDEFFPFSNYKLVRMDIYSGATSSDSFKVYTANFDSAFTNSAGYNFAVFPIMSITYNQNGEAQTPSLYHTLLDYNFKIVLTTSSGAWSTCELQNNFIVCPLNKDSSYNGIRFYVSKSFVNVFSYINLTLNNTAQLYNGNIQAIASSSQQTEQNTKETAQNTKKIADEISDNSDPSIDVSGMSGVQGLLPAGPLDSLLALPVNLLNILVNATSGSCEPFTFTFVFDTEWQLPCFDTFWNQVPSTLLLFMSDLPAVYIFIKWAKSIYKRVERAVSFESSVDDEWGGV